MGHGDDREPVGGCALRPGAPTVLVVDDEPAVRRVVRRVLEESGYAVVEAVDGAAALRLLDRERISLVITDVLMPEQDGIEVVLGLRARQAPVPVVVISGGGVGLDIETLITSALAFGAVGAVAKPFTPEQLLAAVREALGEDPPGGATGQPTTTL